MILLLFLLVVTGVCRCLRDGEWLASGHHAPCCNEQIGETVAPWNVFPGWRVFGPLPARTRTSFDLSPVIR